MNLPANRLEALSRQLREILENDGGNTARANNLMNAILSEVERREVEAARGR